jgi:hypothetical protein
MTCLLFLLKIWKLKIARLDQTWFGRFKTDSNWIFISSLSIFLQPCMACIINIPETKQLFMFSWILRKFNIVVATRALACTEELTSVHMPDPWALGPYAGSMGSTFLFHRLGTW